MSKKGNGLDNPGFYDVIDGDYTIYQGSPSFNQAFRYRPHHGETDSQSLGHGNEISPFGFHHHTPLANGHKSNGTDRSPSNAAEKVNPKTANTKDQQESKGIMHLLSVYADKCSLNGVIFIKSSKYKVVKALWSLLLLVALVVMVVHLYKLADTYYSYEKQSKVDLKFEDLNFPAVTICNVNAMKLSKSQMASNELQALIYDVNPDEMYKYVDDWEIGYEDDTYHFDEYGNPLGWGSGSGSGSGSGDGGWGSGSGSGDWDIKRRRKRSTETTPSAAATNVTLKSRTNNFFDDYNFTNFDDTYWDDYDQDMYSGSWEAESEPAAFEAIASQFINLYNRENGTVRQEMGHRIQDMLIQCSFVGRKCVQSNFTLVASSTMGNCYTIQYSKFVARKSGPREGLTLMLNLEYDEYIPGITNSKGAKLVVHEPGTIPFPDDEGMAIGAGMETSIGLRRTDITRLGEPYGECTSVNSFRNTYGIKYTRQACQEICEMERLASYCQCYDATKPVIYTLLKNSADLKACQLTKENVWCMEDVQWYFQTNATSCHCSSPCDEVVYKKTLSSKPWPSPSFAKLMAKTVCKERPANLLCDYDNMQENNLREYFVKVNVYFETLNYESVKEEPDYSEFQFMSDIGGTVGLYVGISLLSAFEIVHLLISMLRYICTRFQGKK